MANPSVTNTFVAATTAQSSQVNQNFTDLINSLTDGTKTLTVAAIVTGTLTTSGNVTLGDAVGDTCTITGIATIGSTLNVTGAVVLASTLRVNGVTSVFDNIAAGAGSLQIGASTSNATRFALFALGINNASTSTLTGAVSTDASYSVSNVTGDPGAVTDAIKIACQDISAGNATLILRTERALVVESVTSDRTLSFYHNGTLVKMCIKS